MMDVFFLRGYQAKVADLVQVQNAAASLAGYKQAVTQRSLSSGRHCCFPLLFPVLILLFCVLACGVTGRVQASSDTEEHFFREALLVPAHAALLAGPWRTSHGPIMGTAKAQEARCAHLLHLCEGTGHARPQLACLMGVKYVVS